MTCNATHNDYEVDELTTLRLNQSLCYRNQSAYGIVTFWGEIIRLPPEGTLFVTHLTCIGQELL